MTPRCPSVGRTRATTAAATALGGHAENESPSACRKRVSPTETGEPREVAIRRDPFAAGLDGQGSEICIAGEVPFRRDVPAESGEDLPVSRRRRDKNGMRV